MIRTQEIRRISRQRSLPLAVIEKDYVLGWILFGVASSSISKLLAFKGGTSLSKIYFAEKWRLSEDLDFTILDNDMNLQSLGDVITNEVPPLIFRHSGISVQLKNQLFTNPNYLQAKLQYTGPVSKNTVKIEASREAFIGKTISKQVPSSYDYPRFHVNVYSLENILGEKLRSILERGKLRDYYDVWRLLKTNDFNKHEIRDIFIQKCRAKKIVFNNVKQFTPDGLAEELEPYKVSGLTRLSADPVPKLSDIIMELKGSLSELFD